MAFAQWNGNVLQALSVRLSVNPAMAIEVERTLAFFMSRDLSPYDLRYMHLGKFRPSLTRDLHDFHPTRHL